MEFTLANVIRDHARWRPSAPCLTFGDTTLSFADLDGRATRVANALQSSGVEPGDRVAILARNGPVFYELAFGCSKAGAVMVGLNWRLAAPEIAAIVADAAPRVIVVGVEQLALLPDRAELGDKVVVVEVGPDYESWRDSASGNEPDIPTGPGDVVLQLYTSGTTGVPKGAMLTNENLSYTARMAAEVWDFTATSVNLVAMPLFHIGGIGYGLMALTQGGHTVLLPQPDPAALATAIESHSVTHSFFVPAVIQALVELDGIDDFELSSLQLVVYGASPISEAVLLRAIDVLACGFTHAYGMTETAGTVVTLPPADHDPGGPRAHLLRSCGQPVPWVELALMNPATDREVGTGEVGEVWVRSGMTMLGYWNKPEETRRTLTDGGWLRTGDAAYCDEEGYVYLHDRYKDMIVSGGENIYPAEVENVLYDHPGIAELAVIGVPHERWGETVKAIVVLRDGVEVTHEELIDFCRERLARYKCPTSVDVVDALPRSASGKVLKKDLRGPYWVGRERHIH